LTSLALTLRTNKLECFDPGKPLQVGVTFVSKANSYLWLKGLQGKTLQVLWYLCLWFSGQIS
jgi:hypothetical protein